jgi:tetratricopeptide (TPR) repeat protein
MTSLEDVLDQRLERRINAALAAMTEESFKELVTKVLEAIGLTLTAVAIDEDTVLVEGKGIEGDYLVMASREAGDASLAGLEGAKARADRVRRRPVLIVLGEMPPEAEDFADENGIAFADSAKLAQLIRMYGLALDVLDEEDHKLLRTEGDRFLPSIGEFDSLLNQADEEVEVGDYNSSLVLIDRALRLKPDNDIALQRKAEVLLRMGQMEAALLHARRAVERRPRDPTHWFLVGVILNALGRYEEELDAYDRALAERPDMLPALLNKGATLYEGGRQEEAIEVYDTILSFDRDNVRAMNNKGLALKALGRAEDAMAEFERALVIDPGYRDAAINRTLSLEEAGRWKEALVEWEALVEEERSKAEFWYKLGEAQRALGMEEARRSFAVALELRPELELDEGEAPAPRAMRMDDICLRYSTAAVLLEAFGRLDRALQEADKCLDLGCSGAHLRKAAILLKLGRVEEAMVTLKDGIRQGDEDLALDLEAITYRMGRRAEGLRLIDSIPDSVEARVRRALHHLERGDEEMAIRSAKISKSARMINVMALANLRAGEFDKAEANLMKLVKWMPDSPEIMNNLGVCASHRGALLEAKEWLQRAVEAEPLYTDAWNNLGCVFYHEESLEDAIRCFSQALLIERRPDIYLNLGTAQLVLGEFNDARESFSSALRLEESPEAYNSLGMMAEIGRELVKAIELYDAALSLAPDFDDAKYNRDRAVGSLRGK